MFLNNLLGKKAEYFYSPPHPGLNVRLDSEAISRSLSEVIPNSKLWRKHQESTPLPFQNVWEISRCKMNERYLDKWFLKLSDLAFKDNSGLTRWKENTSNETKFNLWYKWLNRLFSNEFCSSFKQRIFCQLCQNSD